jgi:hypothetical protein
MASYLINCIPGIKGKSNLGLGISSILELAKMVIRFTGFESKIKHQDPKVIYDPLYGRRVTRFRSSRNLTRAGLCTGCDAW